ncbi:hypothetical protein [Embleya sp. NBC_00896]|uniref:hypothetical protein n=1 Tax=Embleya sp. NBC_00896 TaxID=2975961 RepID=UPI002F917C4E|nr:hypothetical protein OG928_46565 [Embleya sp. NBC_00896]
MASSGPIEPRGFPEGVEVRGEVRDTTVAVRDLEELQEVLGLGGDNAERIHEALFSGIEDEDELSAVVRRVSAYLIGGDTLTDEDRAVIRPIFPLSVALLMGKSLTVNGPVDLSTPDGQPKVVTFEDVTIEQGGYITCCGTPLIFTCASLTRVGNSGTDNADFNILGRPGQKPPTPTTPGAAGQPAKGANGQSGTAGGKGAKGTNGVSASFSAASQVTTITIGSVLKAEQLTVYTMSGAGGPGGDGGTGGLGQQGGIGGDSTASGCSDGDGRPGGNGGSGGDGGNAGDGGDGVDAAGNIVVRVPTHDDLHKVLSLYAPAPPGLAGKPGQGGQGGAGGVGGQRHKGGKNGGDGGGGGQGAAGGQGANGKIYGKAASILPQVR